MALLQKITKSFQNLGYTHWDKSKITDANIFNQHKIIKSILFDSLQKINPQIAEILKENSLESENLYRLFDESFLNEKFFKSRNTKIININKNIIQSLIVPFKYKSLNGSVYKMKWIDFDNCENNNFIAYIDHRDEEDPLSIPEIVIFVNGIPLVVGQTEKYSFDSHDGTLKNSSRKIKTLISNRNKFLSCNFFSFITNDTTTKVSAITSAKDEFHFWRDDVEGKNQIEFVIQDLFQKEKFLDIIQNFIFFNDSEDKPRKIFARYYQYYAVKKSAEIVRKKIIVEKEQSDNKVGIVWHTQGSGKSLSMVMLAKNIRDFLPNITIVVLTDRIDLDQQIFNNFKKFQKYLGKSSLINFENIQQLKEELKNSKKKSIYFTTIQKFSNNVGFLNDRQDILIITDEAHRSHQEDDASEKISFQLEKGLSKTHSYSSTLKMALPNAKFIGFTGTPIESDDRDTRNVFGDHIHVYAWNQATEDGAVVELRYENVSTLINFNVSDQTLKLIEEENEKENQIIRDQLSTNREETAIKVKNILKTQVLLNKSHWENLERIKLVAQHFVRHYEKRSRALKGKALFAVQSKKIADLYKQEILKLRPEWRNHIEVIVTPDSNSNSSNSTDQPRSKIWNQKIINSFKRPDSLHKILIVVDMLLTGYDVPALDVIYLDKNLRKHSLMQAIARVNRKYVDDKDYALKKAYGLIVSYINITDNLNEALRLYSHHSKTKYKPIRNAKQNFSDVEIKDILMNKINNFYLHILGKDDYQKFDESTTRDERFERLKDLILNTDMEKYFLEDFKLISSEIKKSFPYLSPQEKEKIEFLILLKIYIAEDIKRKIDWESFIKNIAQYADKLIEFESNPDHADLQEVFNLSDLELVKQKQEEEIRQKEKEIEQKIASLNLENNEIKIIDHKSLASDSSSKKVFTQAVKEFFQSLKDTLYSSLKSRLNRAVAFIANFFSYESDSYTSSSYKFEEEEETVVTEEEQWINDIYDILRNVNRNQRRKFPKYFYQDLAQFIFINLTNHERMTIEEAWFENKDSERNIKKKIRESLKTKRFPDKLRTEVVNRIIQKLKNQFDSDDY